MTQSKLPLISVVTPSYNQGKFLEQTITSVLEQNYPRIEHIVIDGGSQDDTVSILKRYRHLKWISEPDRGQADALNKGLRMATGDLLGWVNSDDFYAKRAFHRVSEIFEDESVQWIVGDVVNYYDRSRTEVRVRSEEVTYESLIRNPDIVRQPGVFFRPELLRSAGGWDPALYMVMDLDLWFRLARIKPPRMLHEEMAYFRIHSEQKTRAALLTLQTQEIDRVLKRYGASPATRLRHRARKQYWWVKGVVKRAVMNAGFLDSEPTPF
jgi:glycosyltransferase involved in cell wall biosynthesis